MSGFLRLVRFTKSVALIGAVWTACCLLLLFGWQAKTFATGGTWPTLRLSTVMEALGVGQGTIYVQASEDENARRSASLISSVSGVPALVLLLIALACLVAFYLWLARTERRYSNDL